MAMAGGATTLPPGWAAKTSRSSGSTYFVNTRTGETTFDVPQHSAVRAGAAPRTKQPKSVAQRRPQKAGTPSGKWCGAPHAAPRRKATARQQPQQSASAPVALDRQLLRGDMLSSDELVMMESLDLSPGAARSPEASFFGGNAVSLPAGWSAEMSVDGTVTHWMNSLTGETTETFPTCAVYDEFELEDLEDSRSVDILSSVDDIDVSQSVADVVTPRAMAASPEHGPDVSPIAPQEEWPPKLVMPDKEARAKLFRELDVNGNDGLSLAEIDKAVVGGTLGRALQYPDFNHKPALMRAYKAADVSGDGFIEQREFVQLLGYLVYFNNLWAKFDAIDRNHDRRLDATEFAAGCKVIGMQLTPEEAQSAFAQCDRDGTGKVLFEDFCTWCAKRDGSDSSQATPRLKTKLSEHKRRVGTSPARTAKSPRAHGKQGISRTPQGSGLSRSTSASNSGDGGRSTRNLHEPEDSQRRSPARAPRGSETDRVSPQRSHGVAPRGVLPASSSDSASRRRSSYRKSSQARISASAKASAERLSSPRRSWQSPAKFDNRVVRHARTPPRDAPGHQIAAIPFLRRSGGEIFVSSKDREAPPRPGGFNAKLTKAEMTAGIPAYDPSQDKHIPAKTRRKIAQRLAQAEQHGQDEDGMLADTDDEDEDEHDAKNGAEGSGATAAVPTKGQRKARAESERDADALAAKYLSLDAAAQAHFRNKCGLSVF